MESGKNRNMRLVLFLILTAVVYCLFITNIHVSGRDNINISENLDININGDEYDNVDLEDFTFATLYKGDKVSLKMVLPSEDIPGGAIILRVYHSVVNAYIDGINIYSFGEESYAKGEMTGSGYHFIDLPENYQGKELTIELTITENDAFSSIEKIEFESQKVLMLNFIENKIISIMIAIFILGIGIMFIGIIFVLGGKGREFRLLIWMASICMFSSVWIMASNGILQFVIADFKVIGYIEYLSLYLDLLAFQVYVLDSHENKKIRWLLGIMATVCCIFDVTSIILNQLNIVHLPGVLKICHLLALITFIVSFAVSVGKWFKDKKGHELILLRGIIILVICLVIELIRFNVQKYLVKVSVLADVSIFPLGILVFIVAMFAAYVTRMINTFYENAEKQTLMQIAYVDTLTKIANRAKCEEIIKEYNDNKQEYTIFNFDLNDFKEVNDTFGHAEGDNVLIDFAKILKEILGRYGFVGRMGGDEFIFITDECDESKIKAMLSKLENKVKQFNESEQRVYKLSASYGYKIKRASECMSVWDAYKAADKDMYEHKQIFKADNKSDE